MHTEPVPRDSLPTEHHAAAATAQRIFDEVALHLDRQGIPCYRPDTDEYRYVAGKHSSPVGFLLGDRYRPELEGQEVRTSMMLRAALRRAGYPIDHEHPRMLLLALEDLHREHPRTWRLGLYHLASDHRIGLGIFAREGWR